MSLLAIFGLIALVVVVDVVFMWALCAVAAEADAALAKEGERHDS